MSANFVEKDTIDLLVTSALTWGFTEPGTFMYRPAATMQMTTVTWDDADAVGEMLWRYNYDVTEGWMDPPEVPWPGYRFERYPGEPNPLVVLRTISYYGYQTGDEPEEYDLSAVAGFLSYLRTTAIGKLPGWDSTPWGIVDRTAFSGTGLTG